jgi:hypothetical protein
MSAWFVLSAFGIYPVDPVSGIWIFGSPLFERVELTVAGGRLVIEAPGVSAEAVYVQNVFWNGKAWDKSWIPAELVRGGIWFSKWGRHPIANSVGRQRHARHSLWKPEQRDAGRRDDGHGRRTFRLFRTSRAAAAGSCANWRDWAPSRLPWAKGRASFRRHAAGMAADFVSRRPPVSARRFVSPAVEAEIARVSAMIGDPELAWLFANCYPNTLDTVEIAMRAGKAGHVRHHRRHSGDVVARFLGTSLGYLHLARRWRCSGSIGG